MPEITEDELARYQAAEEVAGALNLMVHLGMANEGIFKDSKVREWLAKPLTAWGRLMWPEETAESDRVLDVLIGLFGRDAEAWKDGKPGEEPLLYVKVRDGERKRTVQIHAMWWDD